MITLERLTKRYGGTTAVDRLDLTVRPGRVTGFLGPNGADRSLHTRQASLEQAYLELAADSLGYGVARSARDGVA